MLSAGYVMASACTKDDSYECRTSLCEVRPLNIPAAMGVLYEAHPQLRSYWEL